MLLEIGADERSVIGPLVQRVGRTMDAKEPTAARHEREDRRLLLVRERQLAARQREEQDIVVRQEGWQRSPRRDLWLR